MVRTCRMLRRHFLMTLSPVVRGNNDTEDEVLTGRSVAQLSGCWPNVCSIVASAQQSTKPLIGILSNPSGDRFETVFPAFHRGLSASGYVEGQNVAIEYRFADGKTDRLPAAGRAAAPGSLAMLAAMRGAVPPSACRSTPERKSRRASASQPPLLTRQHTAVHAEMPGRGKTTVEKDSAF